MFASLASLTGSEETTKDSHNLLEFLWAKAKMEETNSF